MKAELPSIDDADLDQVTGGMGGSPIVPSPLVLPQYLVLLALGYGGDKQPPANGVFGLGNFLGIF